MAKSANMKFWYVTVMDGWKTIFQQQFLSVDDANAMLKAKKEEHKDDNFRVTKDNY